MNKPKRNLERKLNGTRRLLGDTRDSKTLPLEGMVGGTVGSIASSQLLALCLGHEVESGLRVHVLSMSTLVSSRFSGSVVPPKTMLVGGLVTRV